MTLTTCRKKLQSIIPSAKNKAQRQNTTSATEQSRTSQRHSTAYTAKRQGGVGGAVSFYVMVFVSQRNAAHLFFLKDREKK